MKLLSAAAVPLMLLCGCAAVDPGPAFEDVQRQVAERETAGELVWKRGAGPEPVRAAVSQLLATELTADGAVQVALLRNQELQAVYEELGIAQAELVGAGLLQNPVFDAELRFVEGGGGEAFEFEVAQSFLEVFFIPLRRQVAQDRLEQAKLRVAGAVLDLAAETRATFRRLQAEQQLVEMLEQVVQATSYSWEAAQRLREAGNITALELLNEHVLAEQARLDFALAQAEVFRLREELNSLMGLWGEEAGIWTASARLPDPEPVATNALESHAIARSLDLAIRHQEILALGHRLGLQRAEAAIPELRAGVAGEREPEGEWSLGPALSVPLPIFNFGQAAGAEGLARLRQAYNEHAATAVEVRARLRSAYVAASATAANARYMREVVLPLRAEITEQTQLQYNAMQVGVFELLRAKEREIEAGRRYLALVRDYWLARIELDSIVAGRLPQRRFGIDSSVPRLGIGEVAGSPTDEEGEDE